MKSALGFGLALVAGVGGGSAGAMNSGAMDNGGAASVQCSVEGVVRLPAGLNESSVCTAIRAAADAELAKAGIAGSALSVEVSVISASKIAARATLAGKALPEQHVASSDRPLTANSIAMLARAVAGEIAVHRPRQGA